MPGENLFELDNPAACRARLDELVSTVPSAYPIKRAFSAALLLAEAATMRIVNAHTDHLLSDPTTAGGLDEVSPAIEYVGWLADYMFKGSPARIDLINWDAKGAVIGWYSGDDGKPDQTHSCPSTVLDLARALILFADYLPEWKDLLLTHANELEGLRRLSVERLGDSWVEKVRTQGWWSRLTRPKSEEGFALADWYYLKGGPVVRKKPFTSPHDPDPN